MTDETVELGSSAWVALAEAFLREHIPATSPVTFSMCEVFTDAPSGAGRAAWWFSLDHHTVEVGEGERQDVDVHVEVDHAQALPYARMVYDLTDPAVVAMLEERARLRREADPEATRAYEALPADVKACLTDLHNFLAPRTR